MSRDPAKKAVGYKAPPEDSRFKKGQSGNPSGKPRRAKNGAAVDEREAVLGRMVTTRINGKVVRITARRALYEKAVDMAFKGDMRALALLLKFDRMSDSDAASGPAEQNTAEEEALIARYLARKANDAGGGGE
ncbi:DUF5681 domain-containing protein [Bosea sp. 2YAB26]|uniref:DUF5681 domain-containing protein n=1 Tax=Bosea sp. 2YAB26 TaxID=3237478 RepID=UPI003F8F9464